MSVKEKMTAIADAIRNITLETAALGLDEMIAGTAGIMDYDLSEVEGQLPEMTLDEKLTAMADIIRHGAAFSKLLSLDEMARVITEFPNAVVSDGKAFYDTLDAAIAACEEGGTVTLLKDVDVGDLSNVSIDKSITLDGRSHTITRKTGSDTLFVITKDGVTFNIQNIIADVSLGSGECFLYGNNITADVNISDSDITSTENVLFLHSSTCNVTVNSSTLNAGLRNIQFNYCSGNVEVNHSNLYGGRSDANAFLIYDSGINACIKNSNLYGKDSPALSVRYSDISLLIDNSYVQADNTIYGAIDVHNCSPLIDLKGSTKVWVDALTHASIRMRGSQNCDPIITLYDNVTLTEGVRSHIYYTTYAYRTGFHVKFADGYTGAKYKVLSTTDSDLACQVWLEDNLSAAFSRVGTVCAFDTTEATALGYTVNYDSALECYVIEHNGTHFTWQDADLTVTPSITRSGWNLTAICTVNITNREYANTEKITYSYAWYRSGVLIGSDKSIEVGDYGTYEVAVTVYATLTDSSGCVSLISASASVSIKI